MSNDIEVPKVDHYESVTTGISPDAYAITLGLRLIANELSQIRRAIEAGSLRSESVSK